MIISFNIYKESHTQVKNLVSSLQAIQYSKIKARFDGVHDNELLQWLVSQNVNVCYGYARLKRYNFGGLITQNYLTSFAMSSGEEDYLIKIDPDTQVIHPIKRYPNKNQIGCNYNAQKKYIYGGCIVFSKKVATKIVMSELLLDDKYKKHKYNYRNYRLKEDIACQDLIIYDVLDRLNIQIDSMDDQLFCRNQKDSTKILPSKKYCFIHV